MNVQEIYTIVLLSLIGLGLLRRSLQQLYTLVWRPGSQIILRYLVYTQVFRPGHLIGLNPTWAEALALTAHWAATAACNAYRVRSLAEASARAGQLALVHLVPLISVRQLSFASHVLGWSLRKCHFIHGSLGIMATAQGIIHAVIALQERRILGKDRIVGIICFVAVVLLAIIPPIRRFAYELFLYSHLALSIVLAVSLWEHVRLKKHFNRPLMLGATGAFLLTSGIRYAHQVYQNISWNRSGPQMIRVVRTERLGSSLVLELKLSRAWAIVPGQHVYLTILTWREFSVLQRHPFMITWWQSIPGGITMEPGLAGARG
ncbi:hypothetical protein CKM354_001127400 [Cercospora kikuchii]|uniref:Ferric oxidoreductase domain-containing protein n=1 Tax=Cercospora kikuchii TaxID=84275 RepID=A0A9P3CP90_9PEZI|nr:uncharacterized protein CKM354_001127400 [Cercospora kikuchii]GIZ48204.1 hypothetical protein CKM354_001127400 [Cercospora kikuchii]